VHAFTLYALAALLVSLLALSFAVRLLRAGRRGGAGRLFRLLGGALAALLALPPLAASAALFWYSHRALPAPEERALFSGVRYRREVRVQPRPLVLHLVTVTLGPEVRFVVTPGRPGSRQLRARTTSEFLRAFGAQLAINGQIFYPWRSGLCDYYPHPGDPVNVVGLAASAGVIYARPTAKHPTLFLDRDGRAQLGALPARVHHAISGTRWLVSGGRVADDLSRPQDLGLQPRTAVALDRARAQLLLLVVDGRQPRYSEGVSLPELARLLRGYGAHDAINLDGGGSSALVAEGPGGEPVLLSSPIDRRLPGHERAVANHLGVRAPRLRSPAR
jgi:hypothetical protein